jgi:hypothetical protein
MIEIDVPNKLSEITVEQYQAFSRVSDLSDSDRFIAEKMVSIFCKIPLSHVGKIKYNSITEIVQIFSEMFEQKTTLIQRFTLGGKEFGFIPNLENISMDEYADLDTYINETPDLHKALAVMYRPIIKTKGERYDIEPYEGSVTYSDVMKYAPLDVALGAKLFFCLLEKELLRTTVNFLKEETQMNLQQLHNLEKNGDGILVSMPLVKEMLDASMKLVDYPCHSALHGYFLRQKELKQNERN